MRISTIIIVLFLGFAAAGCKKEEASEFTDSPVIESYLEPGGVMSVKISRQIPFSADVSFSEDDPDALNVSVLYNGAMYPLTPAGDGNYVNSSLIVREGAGYTLLFNYNNKNVSAQTYIPSKPLNYTQSVTQIAIARMDSASGPPSSGATMPDPVTLSWTNTDGSYYIVLIENIETTPDPIRDFGDAEPPGNRFRKTPTTASSVEIGPQEFQYYGMHRLLLYHVLPDYASLYSQSSTSSQNLTNPSTSIINGYGIFTGLNADTLMIDVTEQ